MKKIEVEVHFVGGDCYVYTFTSELLANGFAADVFKHGVTFVRDNAYHRYPSTAILKTVLKETTDAPQGKTTKRTTKRKSERKSSVKGSSGDARKETSEDRETDREAEGREV